MQFRRYDGAQVYVFDKGNSARAAILAMGGAHHELGSDGALAFQPLIGIDDPTERSWAAEWIGTLLDHEKMALTPEVKETLWSALTSLASAPPAERTLTGLSVLLQSNALKSALLTYTLEGRSAACSMRPKTISRWQTSSASRPRTCCIRRAWFCRF